MQNLDNTLALNGQREVSRLTIGIVLLIGVLLIWFLPETRKFAKSLDRNAAIWLNQTLSYSRAWQLLWGYLNHQHETWLNVVFMLGLNIVGIFALPKPSRAQATALVLYFWLAFQLVLLVTHLIFSDWLEIQRNSPSMVIAPWLILSDLLNMENLKVYSHSCFPAGHVLVLVFWAQFSLLYSVRWVRNLVLLTVVVLTLPRLISGAHWLSDVVFTAIYASICFEIAKRNFIFRKIINIGRA